MLVEVKRKNRVHIIPKLSEPLNYKLSHLDCYEDHFAFTFCFCFENTQNAEVIRGSLIKTLEVFPMFGGRLSGPRNHRSFNCEGQGMLFEEVFLNLSMQELFDKELPKNKTGRFGHTMVPQIGDRKKQPLLSVRLNHLKGGGSIVGITFAHSVADGSSFCHFLNVWSELALGKDVVDLKNRFHLDRSLLESFVDKPQSSSISDLNPPEGWRYLKGFQKFGFLSRVVGYIPYINGKVLPISGKDIENLKRGKRASSNAILTGLIWKLYTKAHSKNNDSRIFFPMDIRHLLPTDNRHFFGNAVVHICISLPSEQVRSMDVVELGEHIRSQTAIKSEGAIEKQYKWLHLIRENERKFAKIYASVDHFGEDVFFSNVSKLPYYDFDFGLGKPFYIASPPPPVPKIIHMLPHPQDPKGVHLHINDYKARLSVIEEGLQMAFQRNLSHLDMPSSGEGLAAI